LRTSSAHAETDSRVCPSGQNGGHRRPGFWIQPLLGDGGDNPVALGPPGGERRNDQKIRHRKSGEAAEGAHGFQYRKTGRLPAER